jgi:hypothetical protein
VWAAVADELMRCGISRRELPFRGGMIPVSERGREKGIRYAIHARFGEMGKAETGRIYTEMTPADERRIIQAICAHEGMIFCVGLFGSYIILISYLRFYFPFLRENVAK